MRRAAELEMLQQAERGLPAKKEKYTHQKSPHTRLCASFEPI